MCCGCSFEKDDFWVSHPWHRSRCIVLRMVDKSGKRGVRVFLGFPATWTFQTDEAFEIMPGHVLHMEYVQTTLLNQPTSELGP